MKSKKIRSELSLVSIILPTYNSEKNIFNTLLAIKNQTYTNIEVIVIDGYSIDKTIKLVKKFLPVAKIFSQRPLGIYSAMNLGIKKSKGKYLFFLNSDDFISPPSISYLVNNLENNKSGLIFLPTYSKAGYKTKLYFERSFLSMERVFFSHSASLMISRKLHLQYGLYSVNKCQFNADIEFYYKLLKNKVSMIVAPRSQAAYGVFTDGGISSKGPYLKKLFDEFNFRKKYILKDRNDLIYCLLIVPLSFFYHFLKVTLINFFKLS